MNTSIHQWVGHRSYVQLFEFELTLMCFHETQNVSVVCHSYCVHIEPRTNSQESSLVIWIDEWWMTKWHQIELRRKLDLLKDINSVEFQVLSAWKDFVRWKLKMFMLVIVFVLRLGSGMHGPYRIHWINKRWCDETKLSIQIQMQPILRNECWPSGANSRNIKLRITYRLRIVNHKLYGNELVIN